MSLIAPIRRALLSVWDKTGLLELAHASGPGELAYGVFTAALSEPPGTIRVPLQQNQ